VITTQGLCKRFGDRIALDSLDLVVEPGEVMAFLGPNGSGKTTTIRLLMGLLRPTAGRASIDGLDCHTNSVEVKRRVGYLPDEPFLYPYLSGLEFLELVAGLHGMTGSVARKRAGELGAEFVGADCKRLTSTYSHGTKKRLALAAALIHDPRVLILDEPTNGLDPRAARDMRSRIAELARAGRTVFLSTHLLDSAEKLCHRVAILEGGKLRAIGTADELRTRYGASGDASLEELFLTATA